MTELGKQEHIYKVMHVAEAFGAGVACAISQIVNSSTDIFSMIVCGRRDFDESRAKSLTNAHIVEWNVIRKISPGADSRSLQQLVSLMQANRPALVHCHSSKGGALGRLAAQYLDIPCLYTPHGYSFLRSDVKSLTSFAYRSTEYALARLATTVACGLEEYTEARKLSRDATVVENGVDLHKFYPSRNRKRGDRMRFVAVGRISQQKDFSLFRAMAEHPKLSTHQFIWITGEGNSARKTGNLELIGRCSSEEVAELLRSADCYVSTARWEGLSLAALEAAGTGLPLLIREAPGNRELLFRGLIAEKFATLDEAIGSAQKIIAATAQDPTYGLHNRALAERFYDFQLTQARMRSIYDAVMFSNKSRKR